MSSLDIFYESIAPLGEPYFDDGEGRVVFCGDSRSLELPQCDLIVTDPPYGINHASSHGASWQNTTIAGDSDTSVRDEVLNGRSPCASFGTWKTPPISDVRGVLVWDKGPGFGMGDLAFPWKPSWELVFLRGDGWEGTRDEGVLRGPVVVSWESKGRKHPHQKPVWLCAEFMRKQPHAKTILDPFLGSGTTLVAAKQLGRYGVGIEIEERYCETAAQRLRQKTFNWSEA